MSDANSRQVGGSHYKTGVLQHWDLVSLFSWDYFQGQVTKYLMRWRSKNGMQDLEKAAHFLQKYIEEVDAGRIDPRAPQTAGREKWLQAMGVEAADPKMTELHLQLVQALMDYCGDSDTSPLDTLLKQLAIHTDLAGLTGCSSPDGHAELDQAGMFKEGDLNFRRMLEILYPHTRGGESGFETLERLTKTLTVKLDVPEGVFMAPLGSIFPTAWKGFTYEATKEGMDLFRCRVCRQHFSVPEGYPPLTHDSRCPGPRPGELDEAAFPEEWRFQLAAVSSPQGNQVRGILGKPGAGELRDGAYVTKYGAVNKDGSITYACACGMSLNRIVGENITGTRLWVAEHAPHIEQVLTPAGSLPAATADQVFSSHGCKVCGMAATRGFGLDMYCSEHDPVRNSREALRTILESCPGCGVAQGEDHRPGCPNASVVHPNGGSAKL